MKGLEKLDMLGGLNDKFIVSAEQIKRKQPVWLTLIPFAAAMLIALGAALIISDRIKNNPAPDIDASANNDAPVIITTDTPTEAPTAMPTDQPTPDPGTAYHIPAFSPESTGISTSGGPEYILLDGKYYKGYLSFHPEPGFLGENIGRFTRSDKSGNTYPPTYFSSDDGEFAFSLKGYDTDDMLCTLSADGTISVYIRDNGIYLYSGSDLFEDRFHVRERMASFRYYNRNKACYCALDGEAYTRAVGLFLDALDTGEWIDFINYNQYAFIYNIDIELSDDFKVSLAACRDGYVYIEHVLTGTALRVDPQTITPLLDLIDAGAGEEITAGSSLEKVSYDDLTSDPTFGALVPPAINDGFKLDWSAIHYEIDKNTGRIIRTKSIEILLKDSKASYHIFIGSSEKLDEYYFTVYDGQPGGRMVYASEIAVPLPEFNVNDVLLSSFMKEGRYDSLYAAAVYGESCIFIHTENYFENDPADPEKIYGLIHSIQY